MAIEVVTCPVHDMTHSPFTECPICQTERIEREDRLNVGQTRSSDFLQESAVVPPPPATEPSLPAGPAAGPAAAEKMARLAEIRRDRAKTYGPASLCAEATGRAYRALLEAHFQQSLPGDIPPHVVYHMFAAAKLVRACLPFKFNGDNYDDAHNYLDLACEVDPRDQNKEPDGESQG